MSKFEVMSFLKIQSVRQLLKINVILALTAVYEHQLTAVDVSLGEVQDRSGGGALQGKVSVTGGRDDKLQALGGRVAVGSTEVIAGDFGDGVHPYLTGQKVILFSKVLDLISLFLGVYKTISWELPPASALLSHNIQQSVRLKD